MRGETVTVIRRVQTGVDEGNNPVYETKEEPVGNVLVGQPNGENADDSNRPDGIRIDAVLYFPRTYTGGPLRVLLNHFVKLVQRQQADVSDSYRDFIGLFCKTMKGFVDGFLIRRRSQRWNSRVQQCHVLPFIMNVLVAHFTGESALS